MKLLRVEHSDVFFSESSGFRLRVASKCIKNNKSRRSRRRTQLNKRLIRLSFNFNITGIESLCPYRRNKVDFRLEQVTNREFEKLSASSMIYIKMPISFRIDSQSTFASSVVYK